MVKVTKQGLRLEAKSYPFFAGEDGEHMVTHAYRIPRKPMLPFILVVSCLLGLTSPFFSEEILTKCNNKDRNSWTVKPLRHGYGVGERKYGMSPYDIAPFKIESSRFPIDRVAGIVRIPVFLADWSDFNPVTDLSNKNNPRSKHPNYKRHSVEQIQAQLNGDKGPAGYYKAASGGQFTVTFDVFPWISSNTSKYLRDKEPAYYKYVEKRKQWVASKKPYVLDVLRAAVTEKGFNPRRYDADENKILDGAIVAYEGTAGKLAGKNVLYLGPSMGSLGHFKGLFDETDPNFEKAKNIDILFHRSINVPEGSLMGLRTMTHELGHLFLGYKDYYRRGDMGTYAMSARGASF
jgi:M6 family metalloprotease-like protein